MIFGDVGDHNKLLKQPLYFIHILLTLHGKCVAPLSIKQLLSLLPYTFSVFLFLVYSSSSIYLYLIILYCLSSPRPLFSLFLSQFVNLQYSVCLTRWLTPAPLLCGHTWHPLSERLFTSGEREQVEDRMHYELRAGRQHSTWHRFHCETSVNSTKACVV